MTVNSRPSPQAGVTYSTTAIHDHTAFAVLHGLLTAVTAHTGPACKDRMPSSLSDELSFLIGQGQVSLSVKVVQVHTSASLTTLFWSCACLSMLCR